MLRKKNPQFKLIRTSIADQGLVAEEFASQLKFRKLARTQNSSVFLVTGEKLADHILVKQLFTGDCREQYESLAYADLIMGNEQLRVARPLGFDESDNILLTEYIKGTAAVRILASPTTSFTRKRDCIERIATWLAVFHTRTTKQDGSVEASRRLEAVEDSLTEVQNQVDCDSRISSALRFLQDGRAHFDSIRVPKCSTHGDCKPENFIVTNHSVVGIDMHVIKNGLPQMDVAQFANHITFLSLRLSGLVSSSTIAQLAKHFVDDYAKGVREFNAEVLSWLRISHYLRYWAAEVSRGGILGRAQATVLRRLMTDELRRIA